VTDSDSTAGQKLAATPWLHIRSQSTYHFEANIRGTRAGLLALRDAIDQALAKQVGTAPVFASDGEGYHVSVQRSRTVSGIGRPTYLDEEARELLEHERATLTRTARHNYPIEREAQEALRWCRANGDPHKVPRLHREGE